MFSPLLANPPLVARRLETYVSNDGEVEHPEHEEPTPVEQAPLGTNTFHSNWDDDHTWDFSGVSASSEEEEEEVEDTIQKKLPEEEVFATSAFNRTSSQNIASHRMFTVFC